jgi:pimeloyl-ACP methyl ester carboxylesterase
MNFLKTLALTATAMALTPHANAEAFVIVHGAFQDAKSWTQVADGLKSKGHKVITVDLPGRNAEGASAKAVSIEQYTETVHAAIEKLSEPVTLIGHSFGGITISMVGQNIPGKIKKLIYIAAYVPVSGDSMQSLATGDKANGFSEKTFVIAPDYTFASILKTDREHLFINDGTPEQQKQVAENMLREPLGPIATRVVITPETFKPIKKAYIRTTMDQTVSPSIQNMMITRAGITEISDISTGHSPQFSQPEKLVDLIIAASK